MDFYPQNTRPWAPALLLLHVLLLCLLVPGSSGLPCSAFNVSDGLQMAPLQPQYEYPDNVTLSCDNSSLALIGRPLRRCLHTGSWDTQLPICQGIRCPLLLVPKDGTLLYERKNTSIIAQFSCEGTHILIGQQMITCQHNGSWTDTPPKCLMDCSSPPSLENGLVSFNCSFPHCPAVYSCQEGYLLNGSDYVTCTDAGTWTDTSHVCEPIMCNWPNLPSGGKFSTSIPSMEEKFLYNTTIRYSCDSTSVLVTDGTLWCGPSGQWQGSPPDCVKVTTPTTLIETTTPVTNLTSPSPTPPTQRPTPRLCPRPPPLINGSARRRGGTIKYSCDAGFTLEGAAMLRCWENGSWSGDVPTCVATRSEDTTGSSRPFLWKQVFIDHKKWIGEYQYKKRHYYFQFSVQSVDLDNTGAILGLFSEDHGSKFDLKGFKRADDIVFEIESMQQANARIKNTDWYVHGRLHRGLCTWKYEGRISSPTQGFTTLSMESYIEEMMNDPLCNSHHHMTLIIVSISVAVLMVAGVAIVAYYCSRRKGGFRSSGHRSLTSFENPVYEYEHSLK